MSEHLTDAALRHFVDGTLDGSPAEIADRHLGECEPCRERLATLAPSESSLLQAVLADDQRHLTYEELEGLFRENLAADDRRAAEDHLAVCASCVEELEDFRSFAHTLSRPVMSDAAATQDQVEEAGGVGARVLAWLGVSRRAGAGFTTLSMPGVPGLAVAGGVVVLLLAVALPTYRGGGSDDESASVQRLDLALSRLGDLVLATDREFRVRATLEGRVPRGSARPTSLQDVSAGPVEALDYPVGEAVLETAPTLEWSDELEGPFQVTVLDTDEVVVTDSGILEQNAWTVTPPLERGAVYSWSVDRGDASTDPAEFRVLSDEEASLWTEVVASYSDSPLLTGAVAQDLGLLTIARTAYLRELDEDPVSMPAERLILALPEP